MAFTRANLIRLLHANQPPPPPPYGVSSQTLRVGYLTLAGNGDVPLNAPGLGVLDDGFSVANWNLERISGSSAWPASVSTGMTPAPTRNLTSSDGGTTAVYAIHVEGADTGETLTINVQPSSETDGAYTVGKPSDIDSTSTGLRQTSIKSGLGGKRVEVQRGSEASWDNPNFSGQAGGLNIMRVQTFNTHTGTLTFTSSDDNNRALIGRIYIQSSKGLRFTGLRLGKGLPKWPENGLSAGTQGTRQNIGAIGIVGTGSTFVQNIEIDNCVFGAPDGFDDPTQWQSGVTMVGGADEVYWADGITVRDNTFYRVRQAITWAATKNALIARNSITEFCGDATNGGGVGSSDVTVEENEISEPFRNPATPGTHGDFCQNGAVNVAANQTRIVVRHNVFNLGNGQASAQGPFFNDTGYYGGAPGDLLVLPNGGQFGNGTQRLTGFQCVDCEVYNNIYIGGHINGVTPDYGIGWNVRNNTIVRAPALSSDEADTMSDPTVRITLLKNSVTEEAVNPAGSYVGNISHASVNTGDGITAADNINLGASPGGGSGNYAALMAYYEAAGFSDPENADPLVGFRPVADGPLALGGGKYAGALNPDGSWADAS